MRRQQRAFVVEVRQSRRRTRGTKASIWSGTDLKALTRETEADRGEEQAPAISAKTLPQAGQSDHRDRSVSSEGTAKQALSLPAQAKAREIQREALARDTAQTDSGAQDEVVHTVAAANQPGKPERVSRSPVRQRREKQVAVLHSDELSELEAENYRLRQMLQARLITENAELRGRLARFNT
jgi:hypothetical protein